MNGAGRGSPWRDAVGGGLVVAAATLLAARARSSCPDALFEGLFAGTEARWDAGAAGRCGDMGRVWIAELARVLVHGFVVAWFLRRWHGPATWRSEPGRSRLPASWFVQLVVIGTVAQTGALVVLLCVNAEFGAATSPFGHAAVAGLAWVGWITAVPPTLLAVACLVPWLTRVLAAPFRAGHAIAEVEVINWEPPHVTSAISCSGGGARSSAFCIGALSALEAATGPDGRSRLMATDVIASVSGGGYASAAWRLAATDDEPVIGDPQGDPTPGQLYPTLLERRDYPRNGRGGVLVTVPTIVASMILHFAVVALGVVLIAWPAGRLAGSWAIAGDTDLSARGRDLEVHDGLLAGVGLAVGLCLCALIARATVHRGPRQRHLDATIRGLAVIAVVVTAVLVASPLAVDLVAPEMERFLIEPEALLAYGAAAATVLASIGPSALTGGVRRRLPFLGGAVLGAGLFVWGVAIAGRAASTRPVVWIESWVSFGVFAATALAALLVASPEWWSTHRVYRRLLAETFATELDDDGRRVPAMARRPLAELADAPGPTTVFCCAAARRERRATGIPALSLTIDPHEVVIHDTPATGPTRSRAMSREHYDRLLGGPIRRDLGSVMGAVAVSAAAVSPSLGRADLGSTNSVLAALNVRMGAWLPNPGLELGRHLVRDWPTPRIDNLFSEVFGTFDAGDANLYVADGGHWDNLGLVEALRRRPELVVCLDASDDEDLAMLRLAMELARVDLDAVVELPDAQAARLRPESDGTASHGHAFAEVRYADGRRGLIVVVKVVRSALMPTVLSRYAREDEKFPVYGTADQFLTRDQFHHLAILGRTSVEHALAELAGLSEFASDERTTS